MPFIENIDEFTDRQGGEFLDIGRTRYFENGATATSTGYVHAPWEFTEPPEGNTVRDVKLRNQMRLRYCKFLLKKLISGYNKAKLEAEQQLEWHKAGKSVQMPSEHLMDWLKDRAEYIEETREKKQRLEKLCRTTDDIRKEKKARLWRIQEQRDQEKAQELLRKLPTFKEPKQESVS